MKKLLLFILISFFISCTTDDVDKEMEKSAISESQNYNVTELDDTDPIVIPKRD